MNDAAQSLSLLLRAAFAGRMERAAEFAASGGELWREVYDLAARQGVAALAWDGVRLLPEALRPPQPLRAEWAFSVGRIEARYRRQEEALGSLLAFYSGHGIRAMVLKGYGLSLSYPVPEHRPCGDIDLWLFGRQAEADRLLTRELGIWVDGHKEHHTTFTFRGIPVENHYDFVNTRSHASNGGVERLLKRYAALPGREITVVGVPACLPPVQFNALFLLRHAAAHFAAFRIGLRHLADWYVFVRDNHGRIDWATLRTAARQAGMEPFMDCLNAACVDFLGLDASLLPPFGRNAALESRVLHEILAPEFSEQPPAGGLPRVVCFKMRRWWANRWKHALVYDEPLAAAFLRSVAAHLRRPRSIGAK